MVCFEVVFGNNTNGEIQVLLFTLFSPDFSSFSLFTELFRYCLSVNVETRLQSKLTEVRGGVHRRDLV